jgi:hypothetical protein
MFREEPEVKCNGKRALGALQAALLAIAEKAAFLIYRIRKRLP